MNNNICADCIHVKVCRLCDSVMQDACGDFYECDGDWIKADVLQEIRQEIAEYHAHNGNGDDKSIDCRLFNAGIQIALEIIDNKVKELSE